MFVEFFRFFNDYVCFQVDVKIASSFVLFDPFFLL